jgi:hypothetical protein
MKTYPEPIVEPEAPDLASKVEATLARIRVICEQQEKP